MQTILMWSAIAVALLLIGVLAYIIYIARVKARQKSEIEYQRDELHDLHSVISELQDVVEATNTAVLQVTPTPTPTPTPTTDEPPCPAILSQGSTPAIPTEADEAFIKQFHALLDRHISNSGLSVEDIAAEMGISRVQLYRRVKTTTGHSPVEQIRTRRLTHADEMIRTTNMTIAEIAYAVGFTSPSYFTKCYHEHFNRLPTDVVRD